MLLKAKIGWFPLVSIVLAALVCLEVIFVFSTHFDTIVNSQPAYEITLIIVGMISLIVFILLLLRVQKALARTKKEVSDG